jgi:hypothetical protein
MLRSIKSLRGFTIEAKDGHIGKVHALLFDGHTWAIRYLVVDTGTWLPGRKVLIAATSLGRPSWEERVFPVALTREQVRNAPDIDVDKPVSRQREIELHAYYDWTPYWGMSNDMIGGPVPIPTAAEREAIEKAAKGDPNLRSAREVTGYRIHAKDGQIGHLEDFIVTDSDWVIRYLVVDTRNWLPGRRVLLSPKWVHEISWEERQVWVDVTRETVRNSPHYDPSEPVNREYEIEMYDYYGRPKYWTDAPIR